MTKANTAPTLKVSMVGSHKLVTLNASATQQTHGGAGPIAETFQRQPPVTFYG
ncbi:MAG: acinetodin/klebsidin/J25 family lasso peptide [Nitratireductor sp.]|uniref:acinetodin/klebsidin/J25 family lasso peptide n=1 Tax=Nitratireductor sp. TaxID=1872084 RepID=UPI00260823E8|nr:acinetodin/klebsidin/J25 family lasso peptide [Nitratireductor sp.]MCV0350026.1 acinetodin/klebsidin/J25 family lasso peptide [Nitratireductor sp.]